MELKKKWAQMKLEDVEEDPETWITELTNLRLRLAEVKVKIEEEDFWLQVLSNLPEEYENTVEMLSRDLEDGSLTEESAKSMLRAKYKRLNKNSASSDRALIGTEGKM